MFALYSLAYSLQNLIAFEFLNSIIPLKELNFFDSLVSIHELDHY